MRIILLSEKKLNSMSGVGKVVTNLFILLSQREIDIKWRTCKPLFILKLNINPALKRIIVDIFTFLKLLFDRDIWRCEIINAHGISSWLPTIWICKILKKTSLITFHETQEYIKFFGGKKWGKWIWDYAIKNADYIIDISKTIKRKKVFYIPDGINLKEFKPRDIEKKEKIALFVGRLSAQKGVKYFIKASKIIKRKSKNVKFVAISQTSLKWPNGKKYANLLRKNNIELHIRIPRGELIQFYQKASLLILPSISEAFGLVLLEAMACGTPVVASNVGGVPNAVKDGVVGFLVPPKNPQAIAEKSLLILENKGLREKMSKNCLEWVKNFSWEKIAEMYLEVFQKITSKG